MDHLIVGNWNFAAGSKGLQVFSISDGTYTRTFDGLAEMNIGQVAVDEKRAVVYYVQESDCLPGQLGGGGMLYAAKLNADGTLTEISACPSLGAKPCYVTIDHSLEYLLVSNHAGRSYVTQIEQAAGGSYYPKTYHDDATLAVFRLNGDGTVGAACDVQKVYGSFEPGLHARSHLHSITQNPSGETIIVCDKGLDKIYAYRLDRAIGKLHRVAQTAIADGDAARYSAFHPALPLVYVNAENRPKLYAVAYGGEKLEQRQCVQLLPAGEDGMPSDLVALPNGSMLYASVRGANVLVALQLDEQGMPTVVQTLDCGGVNPRGLMLSPDARTLYCANVESGNVTMFAVGADGMLSPTDAVLDNLPCPGSLGYIREGY